MKCPDYERRSLLVTSAKLAVAAASMGTVSIALGQGKNDKTPKKSEQKEEEIGPTEDLMREHGVLNRVLLIYDHFVYQIDQKKDFKPELLTASSMIIRNFVEDYHEKQEEQFLFPRFEQANVLTDLVTVLKTQHQAGRRLTDRVMTLAKSSSAGDKNEIAQSLRQFVRMYRPHEAREDTVLFPELRKIVSPHEFDALGEHFEDNEHKQ